MRGTVPRIIYGIIITLSICIGSAGYAKAEPVADIINASEAEEDAKYTVIAAIRGFVPSKLIDEFREHNGTIEVLNKGYGAGGGTTYLILFGDNTIALPSPVNMDINTNDYSDQHTDDYVLHEFGHVFDAKNGLTNNPSYRSMIMEEIPAFNAACAQYYVDPTHFSSPQEMFAELFAAYLDPDGVFLGHEKLAAAPKSAAFLDAFIKASDYKLPDNDVSKVYREYEYGETELIKQLDQIDEENLEMLKLHDNTFFYDSSKVTLSDSVLGQLEKMEKRDKPAVILADKEKSMSENRYSDTSDDEDQENADSMQGLNTYVPYGPNDPNGDPSKEESETDNSYNYSNSYNNYNNYDYSNSSSSSSYDSYNTYTDTNNTENKVDNRRASENVIKKFIGKSKFYVNRKLRR